MILNFSGLKYYKESHLFMKWLFILNYCFMHSGYFKSVALYDLGRDYPLTKWRIKKSLIL